MHLKDVTREIRRRRLSEPACDLRNLVELNSIRAARRLGKSLARNAFRAALELRTLDDDAALTRRNFNRAVGGDANDSSRRLGRSVFRADFRFPYQHFSPTDETECAGIRMRDGAHEIE